MELVALPVKGRQVRSHGSPFPLPRAVLAITSGFGDFLNSVVPGIEPVVVVPSITIGATTLINVDLVAPSCSHVVIVLVYISGDFTISMCGARKS